MELKDPDLVTAGAKEAAKEKYADIIKDKMILRKYREEVETIGPKIKNINSCYIMMRIVLLMEHGVGEMKSFLTAEQNPLLAQGMFADMYNMLESESSAMALSLTHS